MKDISIKINSKWFFLFLCIFFSAGAHAQWGEQWQDFEDMAFAEGTGNSYWVFDDYGNAYAANNSSQEFQYTAFTAEGQILDYSFVDPEDVGTFLSGLNEQQFDDFFNNSERVLSEVTVGTGNDFDDEQFIEDVVQSYVEALDRYGLTHKNFYYSSGEYGWNDGSAELVWSEYMPITSSFSQFYNGVLTGDKSDIAMGAGLLALDIVSLGEGSAITEGVGTVLRPLGLGSTGRTVAVNLVEQMAMAEAKLNPQLGVRIMENMGDTRWLGWSKMEFKVKTMNGVNAVVHYVGKWEDDVLTAIDDFKFKD